MRELSCDNWMHKAANVQQNLSALVFKSGSGTDLSAGFGYLSISVYLSLPRAQE